MRDPEETIAAIATPKGFGARLIIRVSGPMTWHAVSRVVILDDSGGACEPNEPVIRPARLHIPQLGHLVPCEIYYWPPRRSYTGQAVAEIHMLCCQPLAEAVLAELCVRPAEPGEFTLRAFLSGRLDLTQAEAVLGVIDAVDTEELRCALNQLAGGLSTPLHDLREELLDLLAELELGFDFVEEDLPFLTWETLCRCISAARRSVEQIIERLFTRRTTDELPLVVLVGRPNVGKSTLFNALVGRTRAIVSSLPGTTRDYLTATCEHRSVKFQLVDTAGLVHVVQSFVFQERSASDAAENKSTHPLIDVIAEHPWQDADRAAQEKAMTLVRSADLRLVCLDASRPLESDEQRLLERKDSTSVVVLNKIDLNVCETVVDACPNAVKISARTGVGLEHLKDLIVDRLTQQRISTAEILTTTALRCQSALLSVLKDLTEAEALAVSRAPEETIASALRAALDEVSLIVGTAYSDDVLERIFSRFCIGK